jgi:signal peptidase II
MNQSLSVRTLSVRTRWVLALALLASCIGCDQATKFVATRALQDLPRQSFWADTVRLEHSLNSGGFLSFGGRWPLPVRRGIFIGFNIVLTIGLGAYVWHNRHGSLWLNGALVLIMAGGLGNLIDRICNQGLVTDFINIGVGPLRTGIFNVADIAITAGAIVVILCSWRDVAVCREEARQG